GGDNGTPGGDNKSPGKGNELPETATNLFNYLMVGLMLLVIGGVSLTVGRMRKFNLK
ncbi:chitinase, partial [Litchfieldia salsa]